MNKYSTKGTKKINPLFKDVKEYNKYLLSFIGIFVLLLTGIISYNYTNTSYAKWSSSVLSKNTIKAYAEGKSVANAPALSSNMIPVYYDSTSDSWKKADSTNKNNSWYDYDNKKWANAVTVSETNGYSENVTTSNSVNFTNKVTYNETSSTGYAVLLSGYVVYSSYSFNSSTGMYTLSGTKTTVSSSNYTSMGGKYMCSDNTTECNKMYGYTSYYNSNTMQGVLKYVYNATTYTSTSTSTTKYLASSYTFDKTTATYKLTSPAKESYSSSSVGKYTCDSETLSECKNMYKIVTADTNKVTVVDTYNSKANVTITNKYDNASVGTEISMDDISTMWVWIPRYKYTMLSTCASIKDPSEAKNPKCYEYVYKDEYHDDIVNELVSNEWVSDETEAEEVVTAWKKGYVDDYFGITFNEYADPNNEITALTFDKSFVKDNIGEQEIKIKFESGTKSTGTIKCTDTATGTSSTSETCTDSTNGSLIAGTSTYTHPAFTFGDQELTGIWVGKFEVSSDVTCTVSAPVGVGEGCNLQIIRPNIKPNVTSWRGAQVGTFFNGINKMTESGNKYGFSTSDDIHMMKNMEWGAVTYLSHSKYGINKEVAKNSQNTYTTGCGPQSLGSLSSGSTCNAYTTTLGQSASTTGNVYGVYDMSGGAMEYVMGDLVYSNGQMMSGYQTSNNFNSAFTGYLSNGGSLTGTYAFPESKYYDKYSYGEDNAEYTRGKLGDATKEMAPTNSSYTTTWYSDFALFPNSYFSWFSRGGRFDTGLSVGLFYFDNGRGSATSNNSARAVLAGFGAQD